MSEYILDRIIQKTRETEKENFARFSTKTFLLTERQQPIDITGRVQEGFFVIAEAKKGSPSRGIIRENFQPVEIARSYEEAGASAISVITEPHFFFGDKRFLQEVKQAVHLPVLRKDFLIHPFQVYESYNLGADFLLLIVACLNDDELAEMIGLSHNLGMETLVEVHTAEELARALSVEARLIGINNRDLKTFKVDIKTSYHLKKMIPPGKEVFLISESGISTGADIKRLKATGFNGILIGESLLKTNDTGLALRELLQQGNSGGR